MALDFPNSPTIGDEFSGGGFTWVWTGTTWSKVAATGGGSNDFALLVGSTGNTTYVLDRTYPAGVYAIDFANNDTTYDVYFIAEDGTYAGYTNGIVAQVTADFSEVVVLGAANNEIILFSYQGVATIPSTAGDVATAGAFINSVVTSSLPNINDTTVVNGGNFAADVQVHFIGQNAAVTAAKTVVRSSSTQLVVTRPDSFAVAQSPYTVRVTNPGIPVPAGSNAHLLSNAVTAGTNPVWVTGTTIFYNITGATNITLLATDTEASDIDYTLVSGTLPAGLSLNEETGVISGTFSGSASEGNVTSITVRATDAGGNFLDRTFSLTANATPTWTTPAGALNPSQAGTAYSFQLVASTGSAGGTLTYSLQSGVLPVGLSLSSSGLISGTNGEVSSQTDTFTIRVTDEAGAFSDRQFSIATVVQSGNWLGSFNLPQTNLNEFVGGFSEIKRAGDGYIIGTRGENASSQQAQRLIKVNALGDVQWARESTFTGGYGEQGRLIASDSSGRIYHVFRDFADVVDTSLLDANGILLNARNWGYDNYTRFFEPSLGVIKDSSMSGTQAVIGGRLTITTDRAFIAQVDFATGDIAWRRLNNDTSAPSYFYMGASRQGNSTVLGDRFASATNRGLTVSFNSGGNVRWARSHIVAPNSNLSIFPMGLAIEPSSGNTALAFQAVSWASTPSINYISDNTGENIWTRRFSVAGVDLRIEQKALAADSTGIYAALRYSNNSNLSETIIVKIALDGTVAWQRRIWAPGLDSPVFPSTLDVSADGRVLFQFIGTNAQGVQKVMNLTMPGDGSKLGDVNVLGKTFRIESYGASVTNDSLASNDNFSYVTTTTGTFQTQAASHNWPSITTSTSISYL